LRSLSFYFGLARRPLSLAAGGSVSAPPLPSALSRSHRFAGRSWCSGALGAHVLEVPCVRGSPAPPLPVGQELQKLHRQFLVLRCRSRSRLTTGPTLIGIAYPFSLASPLSGSAAASAASSPGAWTFASNCITWSSGTAKTPASPRAKACRQARYAASSTASRA